MYGTCNICLCSVISLIPDMMMYTELSTKHCRDREKLSTFIGKKMLCSWSVKCCHIFNSFFDQFLPLCFTQTDIVHVFRKITVIHVTPYYYFFSVRLLSVLRGHSFFHPRHNGQRPPTSKDFLSQILSITLFSYLNS